MTTALREIDEHDAIYQQGTDVFMCQWCDRSLTIGWSMGLMAHHIENGEVTRDQVYSHFEPIFDFDEEFEEEEEGETDEEDILSIN
ncbi:MAG: hypothetical protein PVJ86_00130 [Phycisphaerales bacterium]|jgi:hypothetical protein